VGLPAAPRRLREALLSWYDHAARDLPWRRSVSVYGTWIAEVMLQQTTVATVSARWPAFLSRFPDVATLAAATEQEVLAAWSGLGYYGRARRLHAAARAIVAAGGGLPRSRREWLRLPGVGAYTAAAVASIGLGEPIPAVDTNVVRVLLRLTCASPRQAAAARRAVPDLAADLLARRRPGEWNQAVMDLGAMVCRAGEPLCGDCPWRRWCRAAAAGRAAEIPPQARRREMREIVLSLLVVTRGGRVLLLPPGTSPVVVPAGWPPAVRAGGGNLFAGLWQLPGTGWHPLPGATTPASLAAAAGRAWRAWLGGDGRTVPRRIGRFRHNVTRHRLHVHVYAVETDDLPGREGRWFPLPLDGTAPVASLSVKAVAMAGF